MGSRAGSGSSGPGGHDHPRAVAEALDAFQTALAERYMQVMCDAVRPPSVSSFPGPAHLGGAAPELWDYTTEAAQAHLSGYCQFLDWYAGHARGETPQGVTCQSLVPPGGAYADGSGHGFTCGMGQMFGAAYDWAWKDREYVFERVPSFAAQNIDALKTTRDAYLNAAKAFGMPPPDEGGWDADGEFSLQSLSDGTIKDMMEGVFYADGRSSPSWMVSWTGAAADAAASGFFHTTEPTLANHAKIADALGYLVNLRATIIDRNRANTLDLIDAATATLGERRDVDLTGRWAVVQGIGSAVSMTGVGAAFGGPMTFVGWLGEKLYPVKKDAAFAAAPHEVAAGLADAFDSMAMDIEAAEADYRNEAGQVENAIGGAPLEVLALYDITQNNPEGTAGKDGDFNANIDDITGLAAQCYAIGEAYEELRTRLRDVYGADPHMAGRDGDPTEGDRKVIVMREDLLDFVSTTIGRYSLMGSQLEEAAREYAESDDAAARSFEVWEESMDEFGEGPPVSPGEAEALAEATDRNSTGPQSESGNDVVYDPEGWDHPAPAEPERQEG